MAGKVFTSEQKKQLSKNPYVASVEATRIIYTDAFKSYYVRNYLSGKKPTEIFISAGFDPSILGNKRIERASARWRKLYEDGLLDITINEKDDKNMTNEPEKKRRGRPRKNPIAVEESAPKTEQKRKRGRPRKAVAVDVEAQEAVKPVRKRTNKIALMAKNMQPIKTEKTETVKDVVETPELITVEEVKAPVKKRRGRPRKNPIPETVTEEVNTVTAKPEEKVNKEHKAKKAKKEDIQQNAEVSENIVQPVKKRRGRPRKNVQNTVDVKKAIEVPEVAKEIVEKSAEPAVENKSVEIKISENPVSVEKDIVTNSDPINLLLEAISKLTKEIHSLKRQIAMQKK